MKKLIPFLALALLFSIISLSAQSTADQTQKISRTFGKGDKFTVTWSLMQNNPNGTEEPTAKITLSNNSKHDLRDWRLLVWQSENIAHVYNAAWNLFTDGCYVFVASPDIDNYIIPAKSTISFYYTMSSVSGDKIGVPAQLLFFSNDW